MILSIAATSLLALLVFGQILSLVLRTQRWLRNRRWATTAGAGESDVKVTEFAFFHPYCNAGGGGERVLWCAVRALLDHDTSLEESRRTREENKDSNKDKNNNQPALRVRIVIFSGDSNTTHDAIITRARDRFGIVLPTAAESEKDGRLRFSFLRSRALVEAKYYPRFTMLGQSIGSVILGLEAQLRCCPHVWYDSMGYAFTFPLARLIGRCRVGCYVHYPTISSDMLAAVGQQRPTFNNDAMVATSTTRSRIKLIYYQIFAWMYGQVGGLASCVCANSSWTQAHLVRLWKRPIARLPVVFPPCDVRALLMTSASSSACTSISSPSTSTSTSTSTLVASTATAGVARERVILSVAQFRPEKNHELQILALRRVVKVHKVTDVRLILVGSCRGADDEAQVERLQALAEELGVGDHVEVRVNIAFGTLKELLQSSLLGLHTMWNEHFGIGIVEMMAAGVVVIAHASGGPRSDIVLDAKPGSPAQTGFLAQTEDEYADAMVTVLKGQVDAQTIRDNAAVSVERFAQEHFAKRFLSSIDGTGLLHG